MTDNSSRLLSIIAGCVLVAVLGVSISLFLLNDSKWHRYVLFFPKHTDPELVEGEIRKVKLYDDLEKNIERFIHEVKLGPADLRNVPVLPKEGKVNAVFLRDGNLYIDFSPAIMFSREGGPLTLTERLSLLSRSILYNFDDIKAVNYSINGEVPIDIMDTLAENKG